MFEELVSNYAFHIGPGLLALVGPRCKGKLRSIRPGTVFGGFLQSFHEVTAQILRVQVLQGLEDCFVRVELREVIVGDLVLSKVFWSGPIC